MSANPIGFVKEYWRILLLAIFIAFALVALFIPGGIMADDSLAGDLEEDEENQTIEESMSNIEYGIGLDGGTRVSAPPTGMMVDNIDLESEQHSELESSLYTELGLETADATVRHHEDEDRYTAEVFVDDVSAADFAAVIAEYDADVSEDDVENGVTQETRDRMVQTIEQRVNEAGLSGGQVYQEATVEGSYYIVTEVPGMSPEELRELLADRGDVQVQAYYPDEDGNQTNETVLHGEDDFSRIGVASYNDEQGYNYVPVTVDDTEDADGNSAASEYQAAMNEYGFTSEGIQQCGIQDREAGEFDFDHDQPQWCLLTMVDGEVVDAHSMGDRLGSNMASGEWANDPTFEMITPTQQDAHQLAVNLESGALTAPLDFDRQQTFSVEPALADQFKTYSLLIGILSVLTVSGMVFLRYRNPRVAAPMVLTAMSEVLILLGFAAMIRMPLDLSHVAGFIAVVGTGVDDLVIIADEVMDDGEVSSQRVFESRFRKAFWVIGAAAATTIIAMSPLAVMSLGDLRGFAIITILGVLIGVLVTRPAYGNILQRLLTDK